MTTNILYTLEMDIGITELRANLAHWIARAASGDDVVITDHGRPVARLVPTEPVDRWSELIESGLVLRPDEVTRSHRTDDFPIAHEPTGVSLADELEAMRDEDR
jgi:prevent-host-death family protein